MAACPRSVARSNACYCAGPTAATARSLGMCRELHDHRDWLWTFVRVEGVEPTNNASERALKRVAIGRKNWLFAGDDAAAENHARLWSLIASCERHGVDPQRYLTSVLAKIGTTPREELEQFLPDVWKTEDAAEPGASQEWPVVERVACQLLAQRLSQICQLPPGTLRIAYGSRDPRREQYRSLHRRQPLQLKDEHVLTDHQLSRIGVLAAKGL